MKNRTIYDVLNQVMEDYSYTIKKTGNKVEVTGSVYIERIDYEVKHAKIIYLADKDNTSGLEKAIRGFKEELREKVVEVVKGHAEELTDDEAMIEKLQYEIKSLRKELAAAEEENKESRDKIAKLELERIWKETTGPWTNPNPWATGITWETTIGDPPGWMDKNNITCNCKGSSYSCASGDDSRPSNCTDKNFNADYIQNTGQLAREMYMNKMKNGEEV